MIGEIIAIGDELTSGRITNTTSSLAARELFLLGHTIQALHTIGDAPEYIGATLTLALSRSDFVIVTGGLGATTDDLTTEAVIQALSLTTEVHPGVRSRIEARWGQDNPGFAAQLNRLALLPQGAEVLDPQCQMAGYLLHYQGKPIYFLPGVPPQMELLLHTKVLPGLRALDAGRTPPACQRLYRTCGLLEIDINTRLRALEQSGTVTLGYYPVGCEVHVSLTLQGRACGFLDPEFLAADAALRQALGPHLYGIDDETLALATGRALRDRGILLGVAESCTGGRIAATCTGIAGSSRWFQGGVVAYANELKERLLGVDPAVLARHGAVSAETARAMAVGAARHLGCDLALSATGIAGPDGGTEEKPVGTVYLGLCWRGTVTDHLCQFTGTRSQIQEKTTQTALDLVRRTLLAG